MDLQVTFAGSVVVRAHVFQDGPRWRWQVRTADGRTHTDTGKFPHRERIDAARALMFAVTLEPVEADAAISTR